MQGIKCYAPHALIVVAMTNVKLTDSGIVRKLREDYGIHATTCIGPNPGSPTDNTAAIAVQHAQRTGDDAFREFLQEQGFEEVENVGRGLFAWERHD